MEVGNCAQFLDGGNDASIEEEAAPDAFDGGDSKPTIAILVDDIFGGNAPPLDAGADALPPQDAGEFWPIRYTFDSDLEGWTIAPSELADHRPHEAIVHNAENAQGPANSGSLEVQRRFDALAPRATGADTASREVSN